MISRFKMTPKAPFFGNEDCADFWVYHLDHWKEVSQLEGRVRGWEEVLHTVEKKTVNLMLDQTLRE